MSADAQIAANLAQADQYLRWAILVLQIYCVGMLAFTVWCIVRCIQWRKP